MEEIYIKYKEKAKEYYEETYQERGKDLWEHVKAVEEIAKYFCKKASFTKKQRYLIRLGCILHDIGKTKEAINWHEKNTDRYYDKNEHHKNGCKYLKKSDFFDKRDLSKLNKKIICRMVRYHKGKLKLNKVTSSLCKQQAILICFAVAIVRIADNLANEKIIINNGHPYSRIQNKGGK